MREKRISNVVIGRFMIEEKNCINRLKNGDKDAFKIIFDNYKNKVFGMLIQMTGHYQTAEDLTQEVFLKVYKYIGGFNGNSQFSTWLYRITVNEFLKQKGKKPLIDMPQEIPEVEQPSTQHDFNLPEIIKNAFGRMSPREKTVFTLRYGEEMKIEEVAQIMNISESSVKTFQRRALKKLKNEHELINNAKGEKAS